MTEKHENRDVCAGGSMDTSIISIRHLCKEYPNVTPLKDVSVEIKKGEVISVIGPSGTGKSTLLRCINLLETPTKGEIVVDGVVTTDKKCKVNLVRQKMGMVFQSFNLFAHKTIIENIMMGQVDLLGRSRQEAYDRGMELLRNIGLADKAFSYPDELSGGQKQLLCITRVMLSLPPMLILDEATSSIDTRTEIKIQKAFAVMMEGRTSFIVAHRLSTIQNADVILVMKDGHIIEQGNHKELLAKNGFYAKLYNSQFAIA